MKKIIIMLLIVLPLQCLFSQPIIQSQADIKSVIIDGSVRFTILTPRLIRMEWSDKATFVDEASFVVINRYLPIVRFSKEKKDGWLILTTDELELHYKLGTGKFTDQNLLIKFLDPAHSFNWVPSMVQTGNLKGTYKTLDGFDGETRAYDGLKLKLEDGLLATDGWNLIDDSKTLLFDKSDWSWVKQRPAGDCQDLYFMGYGNQFKKALYDYSQIAGKVPLPPRYVFGYWWSRYWSYSDNEVRDVVSNFEKYNLPLDVFVIDMDWHITDSLRGKKDEFGQKQHWTGWTWNNRLFPNPDIFLSWLKNKGLKTTLNLHPASGIAPSELPYNDFAQKMNFDTTSKKNIPFVGSDKLFMQTLFDVVLHPMEKKGVEFWWLDWQQWPYDKKIKELSNVWWLNYMFFSDKERNSSTRPMLYHRWGGLGNHRYQIGFSGDAIISWNSLALQPYFTNCASNVLYGYWSHDIGGHMFGPSSQKILNPELYVRWMQFGALSPIFRTHSTKNAELNKEIWNFKGEYYDALSNSIRLRYQLAPYIYQMARITYDSAISLCRPLYYDYPDIKEAYDYKTQYMFGDDILVAPIVSPMENGESTIKLWLPGGNDWYEWNTGTLLRGGQVLERSFTLEEYPIYVKAGAIIPMYHSVKNLNNNPDKTILGVFPGGNGSTDIYEDAGNSKNYAKEYAFTKVVSTQMPERMQKITIMPRKGNYAGMPLSRTYTLKLYGAEMPQRITVKGVSLKYTSIANENDWYYNGKELSVNIPLPLTKCKTKQEILIYYSKTDSIDVNNGLVKTFRQLTRGATALKFKDAQIILPELVGNCEETNLRLEYYPDKFYETLKYFNSNYPKTPVAISNVTGKDNANWFIDYLKLKKQE
ncbi:MAG: glycoside hydrolase family 31 protein [Paludibacter sp.]|nr:glycoside hydrolase family 31 protein [Paludibacter sp.]